ncbi:MAG TPA: hypothetical protein VEI02_11200, partial [Planctomycetota bacterium]|nr:hypothetical protein [Planctomycetota bacterium]
FGKDAWTTFDTDVPVTVGGAKLEPGSYYVALQRVPGTGADEKARVDSYALVFLDPSVVRKKRLDAFQADETEGGVIAPLTEGPPAEKAMPKLGIAMSTNKEKKNEMTLMIGIGPKRFTTPIVAQL